MGQTMSRNTTSSPALGLVRDCGGQSLIEIAAALPVLLLLMAYVIDFGYFFIAAATITSAARNATEYSILGYSSPLQSGVPAAGPTSSSASVSSVALADMASLFNSSVTTAVQVCSKSLGMNGSIPNCQNFGATGQTYTPAADPNAPTFVLQRVDVTYTVQPPIPMSFFSVQFLPTLNFHRQVSMRAMD